MKEVVREGAIFSQEERGRLEECGRSWMMKEEFDEINPPVKLFYNLKQLNIINGLSCFRL